MDAARKKGLSNHVKERWEVAAKLSEKLGVRKDIVYNNLSQIDDSNRAAILRGVPEVLESWKTRLISQVRVVDPDQEPEEEEDELDHAAQLKVMFWAIRKLGGIEHAEKVFKAACLALRAMEK